METDNTFKSLFQSALRYSSSRNEIKYEKQIFSNDRKQRGQNFESQGFSLIETLLLTSLLAVVTLRCAQIAMEIHDREQEESRKFQNEWRKIDGS